MKIAFVGKGGSGKSTISALFTNYLLSQNKTVLAVDADINQHFAELIGARLNSELALYAGDNPTKIRTYLRGTNRRITSAKRFVKTTPPGRGSHVVRVTPDDLIIRDFTVPFAENGYFMHVGTYDKVAIGTSCYHSNLAVFENIISHTLLHKNECLVADMVAGTDAFAGALYLLFDAIGMVVEPTPESIAVFRQFDELARAAGIEARVFAIGNKIFDRDDQHYLQDQLGQKLIAIVPHDPYLRKARQSGQTLLQISHDVGVELAKIATMAEAVRPDANQQLRRLQQLHYHFAAQAFTIAKHGDISGQVDESFHFAV